MKILFLTPALPSPPRWGGARRMHGLITGLTRDHAVSVLSYIGVGEANDEAIATTSAYSQRLITVPNASLHGDGRRRQQVRSLWSRYSSERWVNNQPAMQMALDQMLAQERYDLIMVEFARMGYLRFPASLPVVLDEHNIEYDLLRRAVDVERGVRRLYNFVNYLKVRREEQHMWRTFSGCALTSARDESLLHAVSPATPTVVAPNAVDPDYFAPPHQTPEPHSVAFFGVNHYFPNFDGLNYFIREIKPLIKQQLPDFKLYIIGYSPPALYEYAGEDVELTGIVDDVREHLARASLIIAPIRVGGGTRFKILEAMSMAKPVVSTTIGAEGIDITHERDILLADTAESFAEAIVRVLRNPTLRDELGQAARRLVEEKYTWQVSVGALERFFERLVGHQPAAPLRASIGSGQ